MTVKPDVFPLVVDHAYIWVSKDAPEMELLEQIGLCPKGKITVHEGQGTASHSIMFENMYLELLWVHDEEELEAYLAAGGDEHPVRETWKETGLSPFGVGFHYLTPTTEQLPIETSSHFFEWMPEDSSIQDVPRTSLYIPSFFILHGELAYWESRMKEEGHKLGVRNLTELSLTVTTLENPDTLTPYLMNNGAITLIQGDFPLMEMTFDNSAQGKVFDLRPMLPLIIHC